MSSAVALLVGISVLLLILFGAGLIWLAFRLRPYVLAARKWAVVLYGAFVDSADTPMDGAHYDVYRRLKHLGVWAVEEGIVSRFLLVETAPGVKSVIYDVSSRGQFGFLLSHMRRHPCIADDERIVIDLGANDGFQGSHSYNLTQLGWWAVLVEANPHLEAELRHNAARKKRWFGHADRVIVRMSAVTPHEDGAHTLNVQGWEHTGASLLPSTREGSFGVTVRGESVRTLMGSIEQSLIGRGATLPRAFGVLSLDIEGLDLGVLTEVCAAGFRPRYIVSEARGDLSPFDRLLEPLGYQRIAYFDGDIIFWMPPTKA